MQKKDLHKTQYFFVSYLSKRRGSVPPRLGTFQIDVLPYQNSARMG